MSVKDLSAYELVKEEDLKGIKSHGMLLKHKKSGARILLIENDDDNKVFNIGFRTPPSDSTGVPHIMEHSVLCGSKNFPAKDPFVELVKGSLNTFLNAMTYPDKTVYPVASCNDKDFQNLMHVYMDAVFYPNIYQHEEIFRQEGWSYKMDSLEDDLAYNGVVYNEMKGAFSSADDVLQREILNSLFPDTTYSNESGGDPEHIPDLTYEDYLDFHRRYYHPCNSYIYLYGNMDVAEKLRWMDEEYLSHYEEIELDSAVKAQKTFEKPVEITKKYPISSAEPEEDNTYLSYNLVVGDILDKKLYLAFDVLDYALLGAPGAPLKQALIDAGIGKDIVGGYDSSTMQPVFSIIAKNANSTDKEKFLETIQNVLKHQVKDGVDRKALLAGISASEFRYREADFGQFPKGLLYGIQCLDSWLYDDRQPFMHVEALDTYRFLREQVETGYFEALIDKYLIHNPHASVVVIEPERGLNAKRDEALAEKLAAYKESLNKDEIKQLIEDTKHLKQYQEESSPKEDLEKIPMLKREDMKREAAPLYNKIKKCGDTTIVHHEMFSNGIDYLRILFDIRDMEIKDLPYVGILKYILGYMDTERYGFSELANEINIHTGGISASTGVYPHVKKQDDMQFMFELRVKTLASELPQAMDLLREILMTTKISDEKRLREIIAQLRSRIEAAFDGSGHSVASMRALSYFSRAAYYQEATAGISFYELVSDLDEHFDEKKDELIARLMRLVQMIFVPERMLVSVVCEEADYQAVEEQIAFLLKNLYVSKETVKERMLPKVHLEKKNEGFMDASQVQYVARAGNYARHGFSYHGALRILKVIMGYDYLWINVRVKGGAYGCMNSYMRNGDTYFVSYRDPNLKKTDEIYDGIPQYLADFKADEREMTKYIIGTISDMDTPMNPSAKGARSMTAYLQGLDFADIQKERDQVIGATEDDIRALKDLIASVLDEKNICVIGNEENLKSQSDMFMQLKNLYE